MRGISRHGFSFSRRRLCNCFANTYCSASSNSTRNNCLRNLNTNIVEADGKGAFASLECNSGRCRYFWCCRCQKTTAKTCWQCNHQRILHSQAFLT